MATVRPVTRRVVTRGVGLLLAVLALAPGCSGDSSDKADAQPTDVTTSTSPPRPTTTTSTIYAAGTVEAEVEAAYLRSWEVYSEAVYTLVLDEEALASAFAGGHLPIVRTEISDRMRNRRAAFVDREHNISVEVITPDQAVVTDDVVNHQVLIDAVTKEPIEQDPNDVYTDLVVLERTGGIWRVTKFERLR